MDIDGLNRAVPIVRDRYEELTVRQVSYLRTYPILLRLAATEREHSEGHFLQLACAVYGWMPRVVRIDSDRLPDAVAAFENAKRMRGFTGDESVIRAISECLYSVVGASKLLHFVKPDVFPIWDSKVQRNWHRWVEPSQNFMSKPKNYITYASEVHQLIRDPRFNPFFDQFTQAYSTRLEGLGIATYSIGKIRAVEAAAFELSGGEYEDA